MFGVPCAVIGVVHVPPLPGAADFGGEMEALIEQALRDARAYKAGGVQAIMVENMHDAPYLKGFVHPETTAAMAVVARAVRAEMKVPLGVQLLAGANLEALGVAVAAGAEFIRVEGFVFAHVADEGVHESCAAVLVRKRAELKANDIKIFADIKKKHSSHAITSDVSLAETAINAEFFRADGVIVTGSSTGYAPDPADVRDVRDAVSCEVLVGSGMVMQNVNMFLPHCDALIVGSSLKKDGRWQNPVDQKRVEELMAVAAKFTARSTV
jgi:membrane complex biogenesis BtpA family protein